MNEANAVAFFSFKRTDGFEVSLTLRGDSGKDLLTKINAAIDLVKKDGATPVVKGFPKKEQKPKEYREEPCPKCGAKVVKKTTKAGKKVEECENRRYDFKTQETTGCPYINWVNEGGSQVL